MSSEIEIAELKAKEIIHLAEERARGIVESVKTTKVATTTNEVLGVKLDFIQKDIETIKGDVKEIKSDFVTRREFVEKVKDTTDYVDKSMQGVSDKYDLPTKLVYGVVSLILIGFFGAIIQFFISK